MVSLTAPIVLCETVERDGFAVIPLADGATVKLLVDALDTASAPARRRNGAVYAMRNLLETVPEVAEYAHSPDVSSIVAEILGEGARCVRGILFDKAPEANWGVRWHQDLAIAVRAKREVPEFRAWTIKDGVPHVQPPESVLQSMIALRLHLDPCGAENGPLRVVPGSHRLGRIPEEQLDAMRRRLGEIEVTALAGDALLMRPLLLHASFAASAPTRRRVLHLEYAACTLPGGLEWRF